MGSRVTKVDCAIAAIALLLVGGLLTATAFEVPVPVGMWLLAAFVVVILVLLVKSAIDGPRYKR